jgi:6-pyruvoyltetrahydropterin/6-carboxytetrahydropterin synthase
LFTVSVESHFWAAHQITLPDGSAEPLHWHNWMVTAEVAAGKLNRSAVVMDFVELRQILEKILLPFNNISLGSIDYFHENNCSAEIVAEYIYQELINNLPSGVKPESVTVQEQPGCRAKFSK